MKEEIRKYDLLIAEANELHLTKNRVYVALRTSRDGLIVVVNNRGTETECSVEFFRLYKGELI